MVKHFINLTNGIEIIPKLLEEGIDINTLNFMYIASTTLENKSYIKLLSDLDHNFLLNLAIGNEINVYDFGTNRPFSKTIYLGIPIIRYVLTRFWFDRDEIDIAYRLTRNGEKRINEYKYYNEIYNSIFLHNQTPDKIWLKTKLKKYKNKFLITDKIKLNGISSSTIHDGDYEYYKNILKTIQ